MNLDKAKVIERIKQAKSYGLKYSKLANAVNVPCHSLYAFINGNYIMAQDKQIALLCYIESYMEEMNKQLRKLGYKELCTKWIV